MKPLPIPEGPWHWVANHPEDVCAYVRDAKGEEVCVVYGRRDTEKRNAIPALVAASRALLAFAECSAALDMPVDQTYEVLERHGYRRDYPMSTREFVEALRHTALGKVRMGPAGDLSPPRRAGGAA